MKKPFLFTLVELLVVIVVIALLMAILMPALQLVRDQTKTLICKSNLKQWGVMFMMYADDHGGKFNRGTYRNSNSARIGNNRRFTANYSAVSVMLTALFFFSFLVTAN